MLFRWDIYIYIYNPRVEPRNFKDLWLWHMSSYGHVHNNIFEVNDFATVCTHENSHGSKYY